MDGTYGDIDVVVNTVTTTVELQCELINVMEYSNCADIILRLDQKHYSEWWRFLVEIIYKFYEGTVFSYTTRTQSICVEN